MKTKMFFLAAALPLLAACASGNGSPEGPLSLQSSTGAYGNPMQTPAEARLPQTNIRSSGIPGESGFAGTSSALSGGGGGGGGGSAR